MEAFQNALAQSNASFARREAGIEGINQAGIENYNLAKARNATNFAASKQLVAGANEALKTQTGIETGFAGVGAEPLIKSTIDYGAKSLYAAGKQAKATRLQARADALEAGDEQAASELESRGATEVAADAMDTELAQNIAAVAKAPGQLINKAGDIVGQAGKAVVRTGKNVIQSARARFGRNPGEPDEGGTELQELQPTESSTTETSFGETQVEAPRGNIPSESLARNPTVEQPVENLPAQGGIRSGQTVETRTLQQAGEGAQEESDTLVNQAGREVGSTAADAGGDVAASAGGDVAAAAGEGAAAAAGETATAGEIAADAAAGALDAAAISAESVPGVGTVVGGLLAIGGGIAALFEGGHQKKKAPPPPPPPPKPKPLGINVSEAAPVMDSSIYRATGYNALA